MDKSIMESHRTVTVQRLQKSCEYENIKPVETIYLKHFEREIPLTTYTTRNQISKPIPVFVTQFQDLHVNCGDKAYFSARVSPEYDASLKVEFFFQNKKLQENSKINYSIKFGLIELSILNVEINDAGIYLCRVFNDSGEAISAAALSVTSRREYSHSIKAEYNLQHGQQLKQHKLIEEKTSQHTIDQESKHLLQQQILDSQKKLLINQEEKIRKLNFIGTMNNLILPEGSNAHFHCRLEPNDPKNLKIDWYFNGQPLVTSSKISSIFSNGYVALNIYCVKKSDEGVYQCLASDGLSSTSTQASLQVIVSPKQFDYQDNTIRLQEIERQTIEQCNRIKQDLIELDKPDEKPVFITPLRDQLGKAENSTAIFEAHVEPQADQNLKIQWYKDGIELENASRISLFNNFGYVSLKIHGLNARRDQGTYMCVATNNAGSAQTSARLTIIENKLSIVTDSNLENGWDQLKHLESSKYTKHEQIETEYDEKPRFLTEFYGKTELYEEQVAMFEAKFTPVSDPHLTVQILKDEQPLEHANRISIFHGFGYVSLKIHHLNAERDSGVYTAIISNKVGSDKVSTKLNIQTKRIERDTQYEEGLKRIQHLESSTKYKREEYEDIEIKEKPRFLSPLSNQRINEYERAHFETRLEPQNDSSMKIEFLKDGQPIEHANRITTIENTGFGFISLDIQKCTQRDTAYYEIVAINNYGYDKVGAHLEVLSKDAIDSTKMFDVNIDQVRMIRNEQIQQSKEVFEEETKRKPCFVQPLKLITKNPHIERTIACFNARIEWLADPSIKINFFHNDQPLQSGSRILTRNEFGYITLDIKQLHINDSGEYKLVVSNEIESISSTAYLEVIEESSVITSSQFPESLDKIQYLEEHSKYKKNEFKDEIINQSPRFTKQLIDIEVYEGTQVQFECSVEPVNDSNLKVQWYKDGVQLNQANRIGLFFNFGYVGLNLKAAELRDTGIYCCVAINEYGESRTECKLTVLPLGPNIVRDTQFEDGLQKIQYLENQNKYSRKEYEEIEVTEKPRFLAPLVDQKIHEYQRAHFETRLEPQNDTTMKIEFLKDGQPIEHANRISLMSNFGFVSIDIRQCTSNADAGYYEIVATNKFGSDKVGARLEVISEKSIISDNITEDGMQKIHYLENQSKYTREEIEDFTCTEKPFFLGPLKGPDVLWENQPCHFETRLKPVGDNTMRIEWYFNDKLLQKGHRFKTYFDFGFISLDILYTYPEDTGKYSVRAYNKLGEAIVSKDLIVKPIDSIDRTKNYDVEIDKIREMKMRRKEEEEIIVKERPILTQIQPQIVDERETARFEADLTPTNDNKLKVEWYKDGELLRASHRIRQFCNFGHVWLEIIDCLKKNDEGLYTIKAFNEQGEATSSATLEVRVKPSLILQTQLPAELADATNEKIRQIENKTIKETKMDQEQAHVEAPLFLEPLQNITVHEQETAVFNTNVVPTNDSDLVISWFKDGEPLRNATRIKHTNDFGKISFEISPCYLIDEGKYSVRAENKYGSAEVSGILKVLTDSSIILDSQLPEEIQKTSINKIAKIEEYQKMKFYEAFTEEQNRLAQIPKFSNEYSEEIVDENNSIRFESLLTPTHDQSMKIEWFHNGKPFVNSSRRKTFHDFEIVALEIRKVAEHDSGVYTCIASNEFGRSTYKIVLIVHTKKNVLADSQFPASNTIEPVDKLEQTTVRKSEYIIDDEVGMKPRFITQIQEYSEINESESFEFSCQIEPANDPDLNVIWFKNGEILRTGTRIRQIKQFGQVILKFDWTLQHDVGEYTCRIMNKLGEDYTKGVLKMRTRRNIILEPQVPDNMSLESIRRLENRHHVRKEIVENPIYPPKFLIPIQNVSIPEGATAHFETRLAPTNTDTQVNWYFNGQPLPTGSRFVTRSELNCISLTLLSCIDTDSGTITCVAKNSAGEDITETTLNVRSKPSLIYQTQLPNKTMELGIQKLAEMENTVTPEPEDLDLNPAKPTAPEFVTEPEAHEVREGEPVRFSARITGNPKARVWWVVNGQTCVNGSKYKISYDGMYHLDIPRARLQDGGKVEIFAKNTVGETYRSTTLKVISKHEDYRVVLKNSPRPWYDPKVKKYQFQRKSEEVNKVFDENLPGGTEKLRWKTEQQDENKRIKVQEHLVNEQQILNEQLIQQNKQISQQNQKEQQREKTFIEKQRETVNKQPKFETETGVHGQQVHTHTQEQVQKQELDNLEIRRKLKTIEKHELERRIMNKNIYVKKSDEKIVPPELEQKLEPKEVYEGDRAIFKCKFNGIPVPKVTWYRNDFQIQNSNDFQIENRGNTSTLTIRQVYKDDEGEYSVKIENKGGVEISRTNLLVSLPKDLGSAGNLPTFTKTITSINNATVGELSRFDAILVGAKPIRVHWEKNGQIIEQSLSVKILNEGNQYTLLILETNENDAGVYHCVARNDYGEASCEAKLNLVQKSKTTETTSTTTIVEKEPVIIENLNSVLTKEGSSATFKCKIMNVKADQVSWYKNDSLIKPSKFFRILNDQNQFILNISEAYQEDIARYKIVAKNSAGSVSTSANLELEFAENQATLIQPEFQIIHEPSQLKTNQQQHQQQQRTNIQHQQQTDIQQQHQANIQQQHQANIQQQHQQQTDIQHQHQANIQQQQQTDIHQQSTFHQQDKKTNVEQRLLKPPKIQPLTAQCAQKGSKVIFETSFSGTPTPLLSWFKDKKALRHSKEIQMFQENNTCSLVILSVDEDHSGMYTLQGENEAGSSKTTAQLLVVGEDEQIGETIVTTTKNGETTDTSTQSKPKKKSVKKKK